jgi:hypothetical protein
MVKNFLHSLSPGIKWPGRDADHSSPAIAEVKIMWISTSTPPHAFTRRSQGLYIKKTFCVDALAPVRYWVRGRCVTVTRCIEV